MLIGAWSGIFLSHFSQQSDDALFDTLRAQTPRLRSLCLKVMLWLLGTAAVIGVLTVLTASYGVLGRVGGTVLATALTAGVLWPLSLMVDRPKTLAAGFLGMASVIVVYCLILPLIWDLDSYDEEMFFLSLVIGLTVPLGMGALLMVPISTTRFAGKLGIVIYLSAVASFCVAIWHPGGWRPQAEWWAIGWCVIAYGAISVISVMGLSPTVWRDWRWIGVVASTIAWSIVTSHIWESQSGPPPKEVVTLFTSIGIFVAHTSLMGLLALGPGLFWLRIGTMVALAMTAVFLNLELLLEPERGISFLGRISGAGGVVASCGTLALMIAARLHKHARPSNLQGIKDGGFTEIMLCCPACGKKQTIAIGAAECEKCGLSIQISVNPKSKSPIS